MRPQSKGCQRIEGGGGDTAQVGATQGGDPEGVLLGLGDNGGLIRLRLVNIFLKHNGRTPAVAGVSGLI